MARIAYDPAVRILAVSGSLQAKSANLALLRAAAASAPDGIEIVVFDGLRHLPHFDPDMEAGDEPPAVRVWRKALAECDAVLIASPEYGHSIPGVLKNGIDWVIGSGELERKVVAITAAVPGPERGRLGLKALRQTLGAVSATIVGGEPIVRGPELERQVADLVRAVLEAVGRSRDAARRDD
jgi:NAD(P)H-dependent FMN reductase